MCEDVRGACVRMCVCVYVCVCVCVVCTWDMCVVCTWCMCIGCVCVYLVREYVCVWCVYVVYDCVCDLNHFFFNPYTTKLKTSGLFG